jgi:drug/metabolite transporter (DMT)-like permease
LQFVVFIVGVAAAMCLGLGYVLQQRVAGEASVAQLSAWQLLRFLVRHPIWWAGVGAMILGQVLGGIALQLATVTLVEPLLSTSLLFAFGFAAWISEMSVRWFEVVGALLLSAALGVFIAVGNPRSTVVPSQRRPILILAVCLVIGLVAVLVIVGSRRGLLGRSVLLASGAGLLYGLQDAATRASTVIAQREGLVALLHTGWSLVVIGGAAGALLLSQTAFNAARLDYSLPPITAAQPIAGIALGVTLLGDRLSVSPGALAVEAICVVAMVAGVLLIGRSRTLANCSPAVIDNTINRSDPDPAVVELATAAPAGRLRA